MTTSKRDDDSSVTQLDAVLAPPRGPRAPVAAAAAPRPQRVRRACLVLIAPDTKGSLGRRFDLGDVTRIGSAPDNTIVLWGVDAVEAHHARIERRETAHHLIVERVQDRFAPTWLGDTLQEAESALRHGDRLTIGAAVFEVLEGWTDDALEEAYHESIYRCIVANGHAR